MQVAVACSYYLPRGMVETHRSTVFNNIVIPVIIQHGPWTNKTRITAAGGKLSYLRENLSHGSFVYHKSCMGSNQMTGQSVTT